jgi:hypothetical protein
MLYAGDDIELDHIVAIALGGPAYARSNVTLTHKACNRRKGAGTNGHGPLTAKATTAKNTRPLNSICWGARCEPECGTTACRCAGHCPCDDDGCVCRKLGYYAKLVAFIAAKTNGHG